jgi:hypothetical protein
MTNHVKHWTDRADHYRDEVLKEISKHSTTDGSDRSLVSTAFIKMAACDFQGIISEIRNDNPAPSFKLFRLLYEDVINGLWAQAFATNDTIHELLHTDDGKLPGTMKQRTEKLDTIFVPPPTAGQQDTLFVDLQGKFWAVMNSYTHGGSFAINRAILGYQEGVIFELLRSSTTIFILLVDAMYRLHHSKPNDALTAISDTYFAESWPEPLQITP